MKKFVVILTLVLSFSLMGCTSTRNGVQVSEDNPVERQVNRSILLDSGINFEIGGLPITLPTFGLGLKFHFRRPSIEEEIDLNLSKLGRWRGMYKGDAPKLSSPTPPSGRTKE